MSESRFVTSADGTRIAVEIEGQGPPLVVVAGAFCDRRTHAALAAGLRRRFTVLRFDRRGRGDSGDNAPWTIQREVEDLAAVAHLAGEPSLMYAHSSGAALALEAAAAGIPLRRLVVYEPPYTGPDDVHTAQLAQLRALLADGDRDGAVELFLTGAGTPIGIIARLRTEPGWPQMVALAPTLPYDVMLANGGVAPVQRLEQITIPVLAATGGLSPDWAHRAGDAVAAVVPGGRSVLVEGQTHRVANAALLPVLVEFLR